MRILKLGAIILVGILLVVALVAIYFHRRALPQLDGAFLTERIQAPVEIVRDIWGVPHIFAQNDLDASYALGWVTAQDRLFQIAMLNRAVQGRLAEWFGKKAVEIDVLFRTLDFQGVGQRLYREASPAAQAAIDAYQLGVNDYAKSRGSSLPLEFTLLRTGFDPLRPGDMLGVLGFMSLALHDAWRFEPLYWQMVEQVGAPAMESLFPHSAGGSPAVYEAARVPPPRRFQLSAASRALLSLLPRPVASNNWAVAPQKTASGQAMLANDPHLGHGIPPIWYEAHLSTPTLNVAGVTIPGMPAIIIGHNQHIAWGFTNLMVDAGDFFIERLHPTDPNLVQHQGQWVPLQVRNETIKVRGGDPVELEIRLTPHGPIASDMIGKTFAPPEDPKAPEDKAENSPSELQETLETQETPASELPLLSYQWTYHHTSGDLDAFMELARARNWDEFRTAAAKFQAVTQNVAYADREGHIGMQTVGAVPQRQGETTGTAYRIGWDGSQDWAGYLPFEALPYEFDPPRGWVASSNNPTLPPGSGVYIGSHYEPLDRIYRVREWLQNGSDFTVADFKRMQSDTVWYSARLELPRLLAAAAEAEPAGTAPSTWDQALELLAGWDGDMQAHSPAAAIFGTYYEQLFEEVFTDELGADLLPKLREGMNLHLVMLWQVTEERQGQWFDRVDTTAVETGAEIRRVALSRALMELEARLGPEATAWTWGDLHTLELVHPLGRLAALAPYFNIGPFPVPGHAGTPNKMQAKADGKVYLGPSLRQIIDFGDLDQAQAVIPSGQSGIRASPHYADQTPLWLTGEYHPLPLSRQAVDAIAAWSLELMPP